MNKVLVALLLAPAAALVSPTAQSSSRTSVAGAKEDLVALAESLPGPPGFWDPLNLADQDWALGYAPYGVTAGNEATIGFLRHAEIKHGRVAMAAFLGFCAQSTPLVSGEHTFLPYSGYVAGCSPQVQWDNIPLAGKIQIFLLIGMLESYGEGARAAPGEYTHYMRGGQPGFYPPIKGKNAGQLVMNLYDPFGFGFREQAAEKRARGLKSEILNGRLAQIGIMGLLAESKVPGAVPPLALFQDFPRYAGEVMAPFSHDFTNF
mmetsp:Transcript_27261/g.94200  ORF Transcript_27261/g.94200 Transcript_27261/m.94200 type:complete len:262 (-) Transcript_27261:157-942(-)